MTFTKNEKPTAEQLRDAADKDFQERVDRHVYGPEDSYLDDQVRNKPGAPGGRVSRKIKGIAIAVGVGIAVGAGILGYIWNSHNKGTTKSTGRPENG